MEKQTKSNQMTETGLLRQAFTGARPTSASVRQMRKPEMIVICSILAAFAIVMLIHIAWIPNDSESYFKSRSGIFALEEKDYKLKYTMPTALQCAPPSDCREEILLKSLLQPTTVADLDKIVNNTDKDVQILLIAEISKERLKDLGSEHSYVLSLPGFAFHHADVYDGERHLRNFHRGERIFLTFDSLDSKGTFAQPLIDEKNIVLDIVLTFKPSVRPISVQRDFEHPLLATQSEFGRYQNFLATRANSGAGKMGHLAKLVLALFCLMLFLIIDSSPESLGLALFMGFEAVAMGTSEGWLPLGWIGLEQNQVLSNFCFQMGDIMKLYFLMQIARTGGVSPLPWLVIGSALSLPYGFFMQFAADQSWSWTYLIPRTRDTITGGLGAVFCFITLWKIRSQKLPWRFLALGFAGVAGAGEVMNSWLIHSDLARVAPELRTFFTVSQANIGYLFALSTFFNISTLENRVKILTSEKESTNEIRRQLELSHTVQKSFLALPILPDEINIAWSHEAATYVSGDTYFVHWDEQKASLTVLLNDVTGHGVQAGLKAFACNIIAKTLWCESDNIDFRRKGDRRRQPSRLEKFDGLVERLLCSQTVPPDFNAMLGLEFALREQKFTVYRVNYNFPLLIEPTFSWEKDNLPPAKTSWSVRNLSMKNKTLTNYDIKPGSMLILISDGLIDSPRDRAGLVKYMARNFETMEGYLTAEDVKKTALKWTTENSVKSVDDRTMVVIQWDPYFAAKISAKDNAA